MRPLRERAADDSLGRLQELVDDLHLLCPGAQAGERVHGPLRLVLVVHDLGRVTPEQRVRLVVEHESSRAVVPEHVEPPVHEHAVHVEGEGPLRPHPRQRGHAPRQLRAAIGLDQGPDAVELVVAYCRVPVRHDLRQLLPRRRRRCREIDALEQPVHRVAELRRVQRTSTRTVALPLPRRRAHARHPLGVEAVRAAVEQRDGAVRETRHRLQGRGRDHCKLVQAGRRLG